MFRSLREAIKKKNVFLLDIIQKGGGVQPESKSFEVVLFCFCFVLLRPGLLKKGTKGQLPGKTKFETIMLCFKYIFLMSILKDVFNVIMLNMTQYFHGN